MFKRWSVVLRSVAVAGSLASLACLGFVAGCGVVPDGDGNGTNACTGNPCDDENPCTTDTCTVDAAAEEGYTCSYADVECDEGFVCDEATGECVEAPEPGPQHQKYFTEQLDDPNYQGTQTCLTCHAEHAEDIMATAHWNWSGVVDDIAGLEDQTHGKTDLINDY